MVVAVIDDGICLDEVSSEVEVHQIRGKKYYKQKNRESHGTICAKIIEKYSSPDKIIDIPILDKNDSAVLSDMSIALECCLELNVDIINLSCGSAFFNVNTKEYERLYSICRKLYYQGVIILAAQNNKGCLTIPAGFPYVLSVELNGGNRYKTTSLYRHSDILADSVHSIRINGKEFKTDTCNSYACAYATACYAAGNDGISDKLIKTHFLTDDFTVYHKKKINDNIYDFFLDNNNNLIGRLYLNGITESERNYLKKHNMRSLDLSFSDKKNKYINELGGICDCSEIPFIFIEKHERALNTALMLNRKFMDDKYKSGVLSSDMTDALNGAIYCSDKCIENFSKVFAIYNKCNVVITICSLNEIKSVDDVYITIKDNGYCLFWGNKEMSIEESNSLYYEILNLFD